MTSQGSKRDWGGEDIFLAVILAFVILAGFAGAFSHMNDWTLMTNPHAGWRGWVNAIVSELMPAASFLLIRKRQRQKRPISAPMWTFIGSASLSLFAQLSSTGVRIPYDTQLLACLPMLAPMILGKLIMSDWSHSRTVREAAEAAAREAELAAELRAEQAAELERREAELAAERAAELAARQAEQDAEREARLDRERRAHEAELAREAREAATAEKIRLAEIEAAAITRREEIAAGERRRQAEAERAERERQAAAEAAERQARLDAERQAALVRAEADAEARRMAAAAEAERLAAETRRLEIETRAREQAVSLISQRAASAGEVRGRSLGRHAKAAAGSGPADLAEARQSRRPREETAREIDAILSTLPVGTARAAAVHAVVASLGVTPEYARRFVPADWVAGEAVGSAGDEGSDVPGAAAA